MKSKSGKGTFAELQAELRAFVRARDWEKFHTPKNLVMALTGEVGELTELFQWLTPAASRSAMGKRDLGDKIRDELADVAVYCLRLADVLGIDLAEAIRRKLAKNAAKYPVALSRGHARKYTELRPVAHGAITPKAPTRPAPKSRSSRR